VGLLHAVRRHGRRTRLYFRCAEAEWCTNWRSVLTAKGTDSPLDHREAAIGRMRPNHKDEDSLPPYDVLDRILRLTLRTCAARRRSPIITDSI